MAIILRVPLALLLLAAPGLGLRAREDFPVTFPWGRRGALTCTPLTNHGTHFTARIEVGTPPQAFDLVADTGSDSVVVSSCFCVQPSRGKKKCPKEKTNCFKGQNRSSTFSIPGAKNSAVPLVELSFNSGKVEAVIASDVVRVGRVSTDMDNGLLLMVDQALEVKGPFQGILGLGLPRPSVQETALLLELSSASRELSAFNSAGAVSTRFSSEGWESAFQSYMGVDARSQSKELALASQSRPRPPTEDVEEGPPFTSKSFLETAGVSRFSMCFNSGSDGVLRLETPKDPAALGSIGKLHWALELRGISVGNSSMPVVLCDPSSAKQGQASPCGTIPDSGTTTLMGPEDHVKTLFSTLCDNWERCRESVKAHKKYAKWAVFAIELSSCSDWIEKEGLEALPPVRFKVRGSQGKDRVLEIPAKNYVISTMEDEVHTVTQHLGGIFPKKAFAKTGKQVRKCVSAFGVMDYQTSLNGPVWVLGAPVFYSYQVGYDLKSKPPSVSFSTEKCGSCPGQTSLYALNSEIKGAPPQEDARSAATALPLISGPVRVGNLDTSLPL